MCCFGFGWFESDSGVPSFYYLCFNAKDAIIYYVELQKTIENVSKTIFRVIIDTGNDLIIHLIETAIMI